MLLWLCVNNKKCPHIKGYALGLRHFSYWSSEIKDSLTIQYKSFLRFISSLQIKSFIYTFYHNFTRHTAHISFDLGNKLLCFSVRYHTQKCFIRNFICSKECCKVCVQDVRGKIMTVAVFILHMFALKVFHFQFLS